MEKKKKEKKPVNKMTKDMWITLLGYSATHWIADMCAGAVVMASLIYYGYGIWEVFILVVLYNFLSFGLQFMFGIMIDKFQVPREATVFSFLLIGAAYFVFDNPVLVVLLAGIGDSLYHVGAGSISLNLTPQKALPAGIFVAPGGIGLFSGIIIGKSSTIPLPFEWGSISLNFGPVTMAILLGLLVISIIFTIYREIPEINYKRVNTRPKIKYYDLIIALLLLSVSIRSLYGLTAGFEWKKGFWLPLALVTGIVTGKAVGGFLADKFGWTKVAVTSLIVAAPLLVFCQSTWYLAILGAMIFQMTMSVTLVAMSNIFEGRSSTAFGFVAST
ncbi:hypothetical protein KAU11_10855, partial [Candidatus Babeliales bacterium]|nr:hypothetical protein [Candidatus Babeliales bacterium]